MVVSPASATIITNTNINIKITNKRSLPIFCMFLSTLVTARLIVSSLAFIPYRQSFFHSRISSSSSSSPSFSLNRMFMSPPNNINSMTASSMSSIPAVSASPPLPTATTSSSDKQLIAKLVPATLPSLAQCGARLKSGHLVSFPTETVYGLGCHALDPIAVQKVFDAKERPLSDPLIVHVTKVEEALELWDASSSKNSNNNNNNGDNNNNNNNGDNNESQPPQIQQQIQQIQIQQQQQQQQQSPPHQTMQQLEKLALTTLTTTFFPGPLTIVAKAHPSIPQILMANTGYVACRSPSHIVARALIDAAGVPIAAPSANKFGHVSPTKADHVMDDLGGEDVWIVDPTLGCLTQDEDDHVDDDDTPNNAKGKDNAMSFNTNTTTNAAVCQVGVESTVAKIEMYPEKNTAGLMGSITILRHGAISSQSIRHALTAKGLGQFFIVSDAVRYTLEEVNNVAPGQTVKHYSPNVPCFMIGASRQQSSPPTLSSSSTSSTKTTVTPQDTSLQLTQEERDILSQSVIIDYAQRLSMYQTHALAYRDLSSEGNPSIAAAQIFDTLRWSESVTGATRVFVPDLSGSLGIAAVNSNGGGNGKDEDGTNQVEEEMTLVLAVKDKLTRAASGVVIGTFQ